MSLAKYLQNNIVVEIDNKRLKSVSDLVQEITENMLHFLNIFLRFNLNLYLFCCCCFGLVWFSIAACGSSQARDHICATAATRAAAVAKQPGSSHEFRS